jgi:hypothetical protein
MFCRKCGVKLLVIDKTDDKKHEAIRKGLMWMGLSCSPYHYHHPKGMGCHKVSESSGVVVSKDSTSLGVISEAEKQ